MNVDLRKYPEYWTRLKKLPQAIHQLIHHSDSREYKEWWMERTGKGVEEADARVDRLWAMIEDIRSNGYDEHRWRDDHRKFTGVDGDGFGPIVVVKSASGLWPRDGAHRSCILKELGMPVVGTIWRS